MIYFDNAATSKPKPAEVLQAMQHYFENIGTSPGRSGYNLAITAGRIIMESRERIAELLGVPDPLEIVLTKNVTESLNIATWGLLEPGDAVITTAMEHNSVIRPLREREARGEISLSVVPCSPWGELDLTAMERAITPQTKAIFVQHASNVTGGIMPLEEIGAIAQRHDCLLVVDGAQSAGALPLNLANSAVDIFAFTGHKSLLGPQGTGGFYVKKDVAKQMKRFLCGGTGSRSEFETHPEFLPDKFEAGTPNTIGFAGLNAALKFLKNEGVTNIRAKEEELTAFFLTGLKSIGGIKIYGPADAKKVLPAVSFTIEGISPAEAAETLEEEFGIMTRVGLQCAPLAHRTIGTFPTGTIRFSFGYFNTQEEVQTGLLALKKITNSNR
ncbi:MAG: aminotransferase class V-fold PLP-dependent enzyme [Deltaproteobacteria bacterium]|nr:aminotransferase class V-fold PLP-dependent enzyme [Deltaproteobacteria bacterium]